MRKPGNDKKSVLSAATTIAMAVAANAQTDAPTKEPTPSPTSSPTPSPTSSPTVLTGCPPLWAVGGVGGSYDPGALVSHPDAAGATGDIRSVYECEAYPYNLYCPQQGYEPGTQYGPQAWKRLGSCDSSQAFVSPTQGPTSSPTVSPTLGAWEKEGCPEEFDATLATSYVADEAVARDGVVYECGGEPGRCNQAGYEPGTGVEWESAWTVLGSCTGTIAPTAFPTGVAWEKEGCPGAYAAGTTYNEGQAVENGGSVFECKPWPHVQLCGQTGYEPGASLHWDAAWTRLGTCDGTITPTSSPTSSPSSIPTSAPTFALWELEGCPPEFALQTAYEAGERVALQGLVFECKVGETSPHCGQAGYEPGTGQEWDTAWTILGSCTGTIAPTPAVTIEQWENVGCPEDHDGSATYEADSIVALAGVVYQCKPHPDTGFCNIHNPDAEYGYLGWETLGSCTGTLSPTADPTKGPTSSPTLSPTHTQWDKAGCPPSFDESLATAYAALETVARGGVVYECKPWPNSPQCNQAGWEPGTGEQWGDAWTVLGSCTGTITPTISPMREVLPAWEKTGCPDEYDASVTYAAGDAVSAYGSHVFECKPWPDTGFCNMFSPEDAANGGLGWNTVGGCTGTIAPTDAPTDAPTAAALDFSDCTVPPYDLSVSYEAGDVVRVDGDVYKCKPPPFSLWCNNPGYMPGTIHSGDAWDLDTSLAC